MKEIIAKDLRSWRGDTDQAIRYDRRLLPILAPKENPNPPPCTMAVSACNALHTLERAASVSRRFHFRSDASSVAHTPKENMKCFPPAISIISSPSFKQWSWAEIKPQLQRLQMKMLGSHLITNEWDRPVCKAKCQDSLNSPFRLEILGNSSITAASLVSDFTEGRWQELTRTTPNEFFRLWLALKAEVPSDRLPQAQFPVT